MKRLLLIPLAVLAILVAGCGGPDTCKRYETREQPVWIGKSFAMMPESVCVEQKSKAELERQKELEREKKHPSQRPIR